MADADDHDAEIRASMEAAVHVHFVVDDLVDLSIHRDNVSLGAQIRREEVEILILALHHSLEGVGVNAGEVAIHVSVDPTAPDERSPGFDDLATISITYAGSDPLTAVRDRQALVDLLRGGCHALGRSPSERPEKAKCN